MREYGSTSSFELYSISFHGEDKNSKAVILEYNDGHKFMVSLEAFTNTRPVDEFDLKKIYIHEKDKTTLVVVYDDPETGEIELFMDASQLRLFFDRDTIL